MASNEGSEHGSTTEDELEVNEKQKQNKHHRKAKEVIAKDDESGTDDSSDASKPTSPRRKRRRGTSGKGSRAKKKKRRKATIKIAPPPNTRKTQKEPNPEDSANEDSPIVLRTMAKKPTATPAQNTHEASTDSETEATATAKERGGRSHAPLSAEEQQDSRTGNIVPKEPPKFRSIAKNEFPHDKKLTIDYVRELMGDKVKRMTSKQITEKFEEIAKLKKEVAHYMKILVARKVEAIARTEPFLKEKTLQGLQDQWAKYDPEARPEEFQQASDCYWRCTNQGATSILPNGFDESAEQDFMQRHKLRYKTDDPTMEFKKGCIAMMGGIALRNARRVVFHKGKQPWAHGLIISRNQPGVRGTGVKEQRFRRKDSSFLNRYCRKSISNKGNSERQDEEDDADDEGETEWEPPTEEKENSSNRKKPARDTGSSRNKSSPERAAIKVMYYSSKSCTSNVVSETRHEL